MATAGAGSASNSGAAPEDQLEVERVVAQIAAATVQTLEGKRVRIREFWRETDYVTGFVRQYGCIFCHQMVHDIVTHTEEILSRGARILIVGNGTAEQAARFFSMKKLPRLGVTVTTDAERESFKAAEFERGYLRTFAHPGALNAYVSAKRQGHRITGLFGDLTQLGGLVATRPPARPLYFHRSRFAGDNANLEAVIAGLAAPSASSLSDSPSSSDSH